MHGRRWGGRETTMTARYFSTAAQPKIDARSRADALKAALVAFALGVMLVYCTGFSYSDAAHNAAHDTRHTLSFPCH
jgi:cobalt transporter subunit CbtB